MKQLDGKVAVVTGAASGIGLAMCKAFSAKGMKLVMADIEQDALDSASADLASSGASVLPLICDVAIADAVDELAAKSFEHFKTVHVVCNNAGVATGGASWQQPLSQWEWVVGVNLWGVINGIRAFVPRLVEQNEGHVVNTASVAGLIPLPMSGPYTATKHAVVGITEGLHYELSMSGSAVKATVLCPGWVNTRIHQSERNWPARFGQNPSETSDDPNRQGVTALMDALISSGMPPSEVADLVVDAIENEKFWILTHPEMGKSITDRFSRAVSGENPEFDLTALMARDAQL